MREINFHIAKYMASYGTPEQLPKSILPEVAFAGRSNVGKSSLLNKLLYSKKLAKVSSKPGKTATINFYQVGKEEGLKPQNDQALIHLVDLPGYGYAQVSKAEKERWSNLIGGYFEDDRYFALVVSLIDIRHDPSVLDHNMVSFLQESDFSFAIALTKADKLSKQKANQQRSKICKALALPKNAPVVITSAETGSGLDELRDLIARSC